MSPPPGRQAQRPTPGHPHDGILDRLERLLARQLSLARNEDFEALSVSAGEVDELLRQLSRSPQQLSPPAERLAAIMDLHKRIGLVLAQKKDDAGRSLRRTSRGRKTLRAYRQDLA